MMYEELIPQIRFDDKGLVPAIAQDVNTGAVLMLAYMNAESLRLTMETGRATYYSRSRQELWEKGATSGNTQTVKSICYDCDGDALLLKVEQKGPACHTGNYSCFYRTAQGEEKEAAPTISALEREYAVIVDRKNNPVEGSYTDFLFRKGVDKIGKKVVEEAAEVLIAAKNRNKEEVRYETADLLYHLMVLLVEQGMTLEDVFGEVARRSH